MSDTARAPAASGSGRAIALGLFLMSGAVGLAYEVVWSRLLLLELGSTAASSSLVLGLFVAGLGLGARLAGRRAAPLARPLRLYAAAEAGAAIWALLALVLVPGLEGPYVALARGLGPFGAAFGRLLLAAIVVLPGATLLGMTLPAGVASWGAKRGEGAQGTAWLYGINTLGAVLGALLASRSAKGSIASVAKRNRRPTNRNGPIASMAVDWAMNPMPHIAPARSSTRLA